MASKQQIFIRRKFRPDLTKAMDSTLPSADPATGCLSSFPRGFQLKGCGSDDKSDKSDKNKEINKDDKAFNPAVDQNFEFRTLGTQGAESAFSSVFA